MLLFVYTARERFVIFTCRYFKLSWNSTVLSQSNCRNFSCSSIKAVNKAAVPTNTKKETKFTLLVFTGRRKKVFLPNLQQNHKTDSRNTVDWNVNKLQLNDVFYLQKSSFLIFIQLIWQISLSSSSVHRARYIPRRVASPSVFITTIYLPFGG